MAWEGQTSILPVQKVSKIFSRFDANQDGHLSRDEMAALVVAVNPRVRFDDEQMTSILDEVFRAYSDHIDVKKGLSFEGLLQTYEDGVGDVDRDFEALGLELDIEVGSDNIEDEVHGREGISGSPINDSDGILPVKSRGSSVRRKKSVGSWANSPRNGIVYDNTWRLVEDLGVIIRRLESKMDALIKKGRGDARSKDSSTATWRWCRSMCSVEGDVVNGRRPWEELGQEYLNFRKGLAQIRDKADDSETQEEAFDAHMAIGRTLFDFRLYKEAIMSFKRATLLKPADARPNFLHGNTLYSLGRFSEAREAYTLALHTAGGSQWASLLPQINVNLGIVLEGEGMLLGASKHYKEAVIQEPKHYRALKLLGSALYGVGEYEAAKRALLEAISLNADYADAHCDLGSALHTLGNYDWAIREFQKAIDLNPDHIEALYNLGTLFKDIGRFSRAADTYSKVLTLQPDHWRAQLNRAVTLLGAGDVDEAKKTFKEVYRRTGRSELYDAIAHLRHMERQPKGLSNFLRRGQENGGIIGDSFRAEDNAVTVEALHFRKANARTTSQQELASALDIRLFQRCTRLNRCDITNLKKELNQPRPMVSSLLAGQSEKSIQKEELEKILRHLLHFLKPEAFQGAVKTINEKVLTVLDSRGSGQVDLGLVVALLAPVCRGSLDQRKHTAFDALVWRSRENAAGEALRDDVYQYIKTLRAIYLPSQMATDPRETIGGMSYPEFVEVFDNPELGFGILSVVAKLEMGDRTRHGRQTCSVCLYPMVGPRFKEVNANFTLCSFCYSAGKVPSTAKQQEYYFKEYLSGIEAVKDRLWLFKSSSSEL